MKHVMQAAMFGFGTLALLAGTPAAQAAVLYDNTAASSDGADNIASNGPLADMFATGATAFTFSQLDLYLQATSPSDGGSFTVSLLSDNSTSPGTLIQTLGTILDSNLTSSLGLLTLSAGSISLDPNTDYWIELSASQSSADWSYSYDTSGTGVSGLYFSIGSDVYLNDGNGPYQMAVIGTAGEGAPAAVPEPASLALFAVSLAGIVIATRRRVPQA